VDFVCATLSRIAADFFAEMSPMKDDVDKDQGLRLRKDTAGAGVPGT